MSDEMTQAAVARMYQAEAERDAERARAKRLNTLLGELYHWALDACHQGTGEAFQSSPTWHVFMSTWEEADELLPRVHDALVAERDQP